MVTVLVVFFFVRQAVHQCFRKDGSAVGISENRL